jgi:hypothetical protein
MAGVFTIFRPGESSVDARSQRDGQLISYLSGNETVDTSSLKWILVVEKEVCQRLATSDDRVSPAQATFRALVESSFGDRMAQQGAIITVRRKCVE